MNDLQMEEEMQDVMQDVDNVIQNAEVLSLSTSIGLRARLSLIRFMEEEMRAQAFFALFDQPEGRSKHKQRVERNIPCQTRQHEYKRVQYI